MIQHLQPFRGILPQLQCFWRQWWGWLRRSGVALVMAIALITTGLTGCGGSDVPEGTRPESVKSKRAKTRIEEVAPPALIQRLNRQLERYQPQVKFVAPRQGATFNDTTVTVKLAVQDLPVFQDEELGLGPHITLLVDDQRYGDIFDLSQPIQLDNLAPGTHTLRAFADHPWNESFKNEGAYAQVTFNIYEASRHNNPDPTKPLLTYSQPLGTVATEPVLLDFYLTNAPLHWVAREDANDAIEDWRVQATINGETFVLDSWQPTYLQGLQTGNNWVKLELLGDGGEPLDNVYNDTIQAVKLDPTAVTSLTKLFRGELTYEDALAIVDPDYVRPEPEPEPEILPEPTVETDVTEGADEAEIVIPVEPEQVLEEETVEGDKAEDEAGDDPGEEEREAAIAPNPPKEVTESEAESESLEETVEELDTPDPLAEDNDLEDTAEEATEETDVEEAAADSVNDSVEDNDDERVEAAELTELTAVPDVTLGSTAVDSETEE